MIVFLVGLLHQPVNMIALVSREREKNVRKAYHAFGTQLPVTCSSRDATYGSLVCLSDSLLLAIAQCAQVHMSGMRGSLLAMHSQFVRRSILSAFGDALASEMSG